MLLIDDFDFELPEDLVAKYPPEKRGDSRLLYYNRETQEAQSCKVGHHTFNEISSFLKAGDVLVRNITRVLPARFFVIDKEKPLNKEIEVLLVKEVEPLRWLALVKPAKKIKSEPRLYQIQDSLYEVSICRTILEGESSELSVLVEFPSLEIFLSIINHYALMPIPPYLQRKAENIDKERYQTVYSRDEKCLGTSIAAPTAGLHFTDEIIAQLSAMGVTFIDLNLDVGIGTFKPVSVSRVEDHKMHFETYSISEENWLQLQKAKAEGRRVIAVGTTSLRCLESVAMTGNLSGATNLFVYPGNFKFQVIDGLLTNFHLPKSTLLLLVSALIGIDKMKELYKIAIENKYRFFSYGDCCLIL